jgi:hypothetical protein
VMKVMWLAKAVAAQSRLELLDCLLNKAGVMGKDYGKI